MRHSTRTYQFQTNKQTRHFIDTLIDNMIEFRVEYTSYGSTKVKVTTSLDVHKILAKTCEFIKTA